jgi:uncharacterized RDD family membrane protein YckC
LICRRCGQELTEGVRACASCGELVGDHPPTSEPELAATARPAVRRSVVYAGFWLRAVAYLIDVVLLTMVGGMAILMPLLAKGAIPADKPWFLVTEQTRQVIAIQLLFNMVSWLYFASFESSVWQATPGKRILGLIVVDLAGRRISFARASGRFFGKFISQLLLFFGFVMAGFTPRKQALHDLLASCLVIRRPKQS